MATIPTERTWTTSEATDQVMMNNMSLCQDFLFQRPSAHLYTQNGLWITQNATTLINWDVSYFQNDSNWSMANPSRIICNTSGYYNVTAGAVWGSGTSQTLGSVSRIMVAKNSAGTWPGIASDNACLTDCHVAPGGGYVGGATGITLQGSGMANHVDGPYFLTSGDYLEMWIQYYRNSGTVQRYVRPGAFRTFMAIGWQEA